MQTTNTIHAQLPPCSSLPTLERNDYAPPNKDVSNLQQSLDNQGYSLDIDGIFGRQTEQAVEKFQTKKRITVDGIVGPQTWNQLKACVFEPRC